MLMLPRVLAALILAAGLTTACQDDSKKDDSNGTTPVGAPNAGAPDPSATTVAATMVVTLGASSQPAGSAGAATTTSQPVSPSGISWANVQTIFQNRCTPCHGAGGRLPELDQYPFTPLPGEASWQTLSEISQRINASQDAMPPNGSLTSTERQTLNTWLNVGGPATPTLSTTRGLAQTLTTTEDAWSNLSLVAQWSAAGGPLSPWTRLARQADGTYTVALGQLAVGTLVTSHIRATDVASGTTVMDATPPASAVSSSGTVPISLVSPQSP